MFLHPNRNFSSCSFFSLNDNMLRIEKANKMQIDISFDKLAKKSIN